MQQLTVCHWPGPVVPVARGLFVIAVATSAQRDTARQQVRRALCELLAQILKCAPQSIGIDNQRGRAPQLSVDGQPTSLGCSFSYADQWALAALHLHGEVGVDLMAPAEIPDWQAVARDYLGPELAATLAATPAAQRARAFSNAWCALEAGLKCRGTALGEWQAGRSSAAQQATLTIPPFSSNLSLASAALPFAAAELSAHLVWQPRT